jgi:hypothetical protein
MADQTTFDARLQDAFDRYLAAAPTAVDARSMAAATLAGSRVDPRDRVWWRLGGFGRLALASVVVAVALALLAVGAGGLLHGPRRSEAPPSVPAASPVGSPVAQATLAPAAGPWAALYLRENQCACSKIDVVEVRADGTERLIRSIAATVPGAKAALWTTGARVSSTGWLHLYEEGSDTGGTDESAIVDLTDPTAAPRLLTWSAPLGPRWSSNGLLAIPGFGPGAHGPVDLWSTVTILDPVTGRTTELGSLSLFGGGPSIVWAADGSGILDGGRLRPVDGGPDIDIAAGLRFADRRVGAGSATIDICDPKTNGECTGAAGRVIRVLDRAHLATTWWTSPPGSDQPTTAMFAADGRAILAMFDRTLGDGRHVAVLTRLDAPDRRTELTTWALREGGFGPSFDEPDPNDFLFPTWYSTGPTDNPAFARGPILHADGTVTANSDGDLAGYVPTSLFQ